MVLNSFNGPILKNLQIKNRVEKYIKIPNNIKATNFTIPIA
jgi:hypothetical protein